jgi:ABC-type sugar transport system permease subunit
MTVNPATASPKRNSVWSDLQSRIPQILALLVFDVFIVWIISNTLSMGFYSLTAVLAVVALFMNAVFLVPRFAPVRWMAIGISGMIIFVIYPILFTIYIGFTNYGDGHLLTRQQALEQILARQYLPEEGKAYSWTAFKSDDELYVLWLQDEEGNAFLARPDQAIQPGIAGQDGVGELDGSGIPAEIEGYSRLNAILATTDKNLTEIKFGAAGQTIQVRSPSEAAELLPRYTHDEVADTIFDIETQTLYTNIEGTFTSREGDEIKPGFRASVGLGNFEEFFTSPSLRGPLVRIAIWNFVFPTISVVSTFALGLAIAIMFNQADFPLKRTIRSFLIIPYTIPGLITIIIWRGMMNVEFGVINRTLINLFGPDARVPWTTEPIWAQLAVLIVNLWLGYPYFMLICSGALQAIPSDLYEAAQVDGASNWQQFRKITLPLLLVAVGPLLLASFIYNFNNFNLIYLFIQGGPPIVGATTRAGHTDILISYVYQLAFSGGGRGVQYGLASAITIVLFMVVALMTLVQFRFTNMWEEVSENV